MENSQQELPYGLSNTIIQRESAFDRSVTYFVEKLPLDHLCVNSVPVIALCELKVFIQALKKTSPGRTVYLI